MKIFKKAIFVLLMIYTFSTYAVDISAGGGNIPVNAVFVGDYNPNDEDSDGIENNLDNCPWIYNPSQADQDGDGAGDDCDYDQDFDGVLDSFDNCPYVGNPSQEDQDSDRVGDACDNNTNNDGEHFDLDEIPDNFDNCPWRHNPSQEDQDSDGIGDLCDNCLTTPNFDQIDFDYDGIGDACRDIDVYIDSDDDGILDNHDNCPLESNPTQANFDQDEMGDACDTDDDNDMVKDSGDKCLYTPLGKVTDAKGCSASQLVNIDCHTASAIWKTKENYKKYLNGFLNNLKQKGIISGAEKGQLTSKGSQLRCW